MKSKLIINSSNTQELKALGTYFEIKNHLEQTLNNKLGVKGWDTLVEKIKALKQAVILNKENLLALGKKDSLKEGKASASTMLQLDIKAKTRRELEEKINIIIAIFDAERFDPYQYYEKTKIEKFQSSSRLEGIEIQIPDKSISLESVLAKYRR